MLQAAEEVVGSAARRGRRRRGLATAPQPAVVDDRLDAKAGEVVGQVVQAFFDVVAEREPIVRMEPAAFFFGERLGGGFAGLGVLGRWPRSEARCSRSRKSMGGSGGNVGGVA